MRPRNPVLAPLALLLARLRASARPPSLGEWALGLTVLGWSLIWAHGLGLVMLGTIWVPIALFAIGLALIPLLGGQDPAGQMLPWRRFGDASASGAFSAAATPARVDTDGSRIDAARAPTAAAVTPATEPAS